MGVFDRLESKLERSFMAPFVRAFRSEVQPVEIASAIRRAMDDRAALVGKGRALVPNVFTVELSSTDFDRLSGYEADLSDELVAAAEEHAGTQGYHPGGPIEIELREDSAIETGVFRIRPATAKRPHATGMTGQQPRVHARDPYAAQPAPRHTPPPPVVTHAEPDAEDPTPYRGSAVRESRAPATTVHDPLAPAPSRRVNPADRPWLDVDGDRYPLMGAMTVLGRDDDADIILDDPGISRRHSEIRVTIDGPHFVTTIRDLGSTNGTFVNGDRVTSQRLEDGDRITVGRTSVHYRLGRR